MRIRIQLSIITFLFLVFISCGKSDERGVGYSKIIDGDTFITERGVEVRLIGLDTPETGERYSIDAAKSLKRVLETGPIRLEYDIQRFDKYGRTLAFVYAGTTFVNEVLLDSGLAVAYFHPPNLKFFDEFFLLVHEDAPV